MIKNFCFILLCFTASLSSGQQLGTIHKIGQEEGLSDNYILSIDQDEKGYLWIGTEWGLNRYNGREFTSYKVNLDDTNTVSHNGINKVLVDTTEHVIWIGTKGAGLNTYNYKTDQFYHYPLHTNARNATRANGITDICFTDDGKLWLSTYRAGLRLLDKTTNKIKRIELTGANLPEVYRIWCIEDDLNGHLYIGHWGDGFTVYSTKDSLAKNYYASPHLPQGLPGNDVVDICIDDKNNAWLATNEGLARYNPVKETFTVFQMQANQPESLSDNHIRSVMQIGQELYIGTLNGGVNILDLERTDFSKPEEAKFKHLQAGNLPSNLSSPAIERMFQDAFGNIWLGTYGEGLNVIQHTQSFFKTLSYANIIGDKHGLSGRSVNCLGSGENKQLYMGLSNGLVDIYQPNSKGYPFYKTQTLNLEHSILCEWYSSEGIWWFGCKGEGLKTYDPNKKSIHLPTRLTKQFCTDRVSCLFEDREQNMWIGTDCGILKYNPRTGSIEQRNGSEIGLRDNLIRQIIQDVNGNLWVGSEINGVALITTDFELLEYFYVGHGLKAHNINDIYEDAQNRIWVATKKGLSCFPDVKDFKYDSFTLDLASGLEDNYIRSVMEGQKDEIWMTSNAGISRYQYLNQKIDNFNQKDGIPRENFNNGSAIKLPDGTLIFGSQNGICYFNAHRPLPSVRLPPTLITQIEVYDAKVRTTQKLNGQSDLSQLEFSHSQNTLSFSFHIMDYAYTDKVSYSYLLEGIGDNVWHTSETGNKVSFRNLAPGTYTFHVKAGLQNPEINAQSDRIQFKIKRPFWKTWAARIFYILFVGILIYLILDFFKRKIELENQLFYEKENANREQEINQERLSFFTNIAHELKTPLTLILSPLEDWIQQEGGNKKLRLIHNNAVRLNELIKQLMEFRKSETQHKPLAVKKASLTPLVNEIILKYKELNKNPDLRINAQLNTCPQLWIDPEILTMILDNLISNALKNTPQGNVNISLKAVKIENKDWVEIKVQDTGIGIPTEELSKIFDRYYQVKREQKIPGTGIGLALVRNLIALHKATISVESKVNEGSTFTLRFSCDERYPEAQQLSEEVAPSPLNKEAPQMLIIEDNEDIKNYIADIFRTEFEVYTARDGQEGFALAKEKVPDIIISDVMMPIMDGNELCQLLKGNINTSHIPIVLLTAKDSEQDKLAGYLRGADSYLTKPFRSELLKTRVQNLLQNRAQIAAYISSGHIKKDELHKALSAIDHDFIKQTLDLIEKNIEMEQMTVSFLAEQRHMSNSSFSRKIKAITGLTVTELIKETKIKRAEELLLSGKYSISETAYHLGYSSLAYFRKVFKEKYGTSPSQYLENIKKQ